MSAQDEEAIQHFAAIEGIDPDLAESLLSLPWFADGMRSNSELWVVAELRRIAEIDPDFAKNLLGLRWMRDEVLSSQYQEMQALNALAQADLAVAKRISTLPWFVDGVTYDESRLLDRLSEISTDWPTWPERLMAMRGIADGNITEEDFLSVDRIGFLITAEFVSLAERLMALSWVNDGITPGLGEEIDVMASLRRVAFVDLSLAERIAGLEWVRDGLTEDDREAIFFLARAAERDLVFAKRIIGLPILANGISASEMTEIESIRESSHRFLINRFGHLPWVADGLGPAEAKGASNLAFMAEEFPSLAASVMTYTWVTDGYEWIPVDEGRILGLLISIAQRDIRLAEDVASLPWMADDITPLEDEVLEYLSFWARDDLDVARELTSLAAVTDGVSEVELAIIDEVGRRPHRDFSVVDTLSGLPWLADEITNAEAWMIRFGADLAHADPSLAKAVLTYPWMGDGISVREASAVGYISEMSQSDSSATRLVVDSTWLANSLEDSEVAALGIAASLLTADQELAFFVLNMGAEADEQTGWALSTLNFEFQEYPSVQKQVVASDWFQDGLTGAEGALIIALGCCNDQVEIIQGLLNEGKVIHRQQSLPLSGDVNVFVVSRTGFENEEYVLDAVENGIRIQEEFMGEPWPDATVNIVVEPDWSYPAVGLNDPYRITIAYFVKGLLFHELSHEYVSGALPSWLSEGAANFLGSYTSILVDGTGDYSPSRMQQAIQDPLRRCADAGYPTIQDWIDVFGNPVFTTSFPANCQYRLGQAFVQELYKALGHPVVSSTLRQLYLEVKGGNTSISEQMVYETFLSNTPASKRGEFRDIYSQLHGGPIPGG